MTEAYPSIADLRQAVEALKAVEPAGPFVAMMWLSREEADRLYPGAVGITHGICHVEAAEPPAPRAPKPKRPAYTRLHGRWGR